jgi:hypothetical protein
MSPLAAITAAFEALTAWFKTAAIRERRELRTEARNLRHEILNAADTGNARLLSELQDALTDNERDRQALLTAARAPSQ